MKYFITTAIDYTNAPPHVGHAYEKVLADSIARYHRLIGQEVFFLTGVDQHGQKVQQSAARNGLPPKEFADRVTDQFLDLYRRLDISYDGWAATTDFRHKRAVQKVLQELYDQDELYKAKYSGYYSIRQEQFLTDKERDENGEFGPEWGEVIFLEEENWYFRLAKHKEWLKDFVGRQPGFVTPIFRQNELLNAIDRLSGDLCVSRPEERLSWGIPFPFDPEYVVYVWFDALLNYVTFAGYKAEPAYGLPVFTELWPCKAHVIGKDILVPPHGIYWPIMLHAMGFQDEQMPRLVVHGWWNSSGAKMSKSLGNVIDPQQLIERFGPDAIRYYLLRDVVMGQDADFSIERLIERYNSELANEFGNLLNRTLSMALRYRNGELRKAVSPDPDLAEFASATSSMIARYEAAFAEFQVHQALEIVRELVARANSLVELKAPWKLAKDPAQSDLLDAVLYTLAEAARLCALMLSPVVPNASAKMLAQLRADSERKLVWGELGDRHPVNKPSPVFPKLELAADKSQLPSTLSDA
jgi:methionyl-tRNA synthetase